MTTIPSRLAQVTRMSSSPQEARQRVINLYRAWYRAAPEIETLYAIPLSQSQIRDAIRQKFEHNRYVTDPRAVEVLILKGTQELQETLNCWKQTDHVMGILLKNETRRERGFLEKFYEGRDEDAVRPAASGVF
ncbi:NdufA6 NADH-ubiquinone oxidoreductase 14.8 kDa subunit [Hygrophoropsis aurantiaca]|uniref:NdufA6 NADH-ubiquinone oxidoreductase 14.8 kDa subunit n=1 Tax=Hygrophoropsis aurantiaca TaxID=72124 RepID=A0ACB8A1H2_9AGAM|nr:NdufA6 NADH-ubiquinone oxidoreductase 14.8 kDa subunit [Hygrophoropsis aurantiaca]